MQPLRIFAKAHYADVSVRVQRRLSGQHHREKCGRSASLNSQKCQINLLLIDNDGPNRYHPPLKLRVFRTCKTQPKPHVGTRYTDTRLYAVPRGEDNAFCD